MSDVITTFPNTELETNGAERIEMPAVAEEQQVFRFDRRTSERHDLEGQVTALRRDHDVEAYTHPVCTLDLMNMSELGMAAHSEIPLADSERVSVYFPPHGSDMGLELMGHVVRCTPVTREEAATRRQPLGREYEIAIQFDPRTAA